MPARPQFSLKAILVIIAVLSVPLAMMRMSVWIGVLFLLPALSGSVGYLLGGKERMPYWLAAGLLVMVFLQHALIEISGVFSIESFYIPSLSTLQGL